MPSLSLAGLKLVFTLMIDLIRGYEQGKKDLFTSHVEPLHARMLAIHEDYVEGFEEVERYLASRDVPPAELITFLEHRRRDYLAERDLARKLAQELARADRRLVRDEVWTLLKNYCQAAVTYFSCASGMGGYSWYSDFLHAIRSRVQAGVTGADVWRSGGFSNNPRGDLLKKVRLNLNERLPGALEPLNAYYAALRARLL